MSTLKKTSVWRNAESAILPVVTRLFAVGDAIPALQANKVFRYGGTQEYVGTKDYPKLRSRVVLVSSPDAQKRDAELFPVAIAPVLRRLSEEPHAFVEGSLKGAVQDTLRGAGLDKGSFPGFYTNESYYYAFCRELLARLDRAGAVPVSAGPIATDARGVAWIRGTQVKALEVVASHVAHGWSADEIRRQHPGLELAAIHGVLAWYYENRAACDAKLAVDLQLAERLRDDQEPSPLVARLRRAERAA